MAPIGGVRAGYLSAGKDAIPDSIVSRDPDDNTGNSNDDTGLQISLSQDWPDIQAKISSNHTTASDEEMVIGDTNGNDIAIVDISSNVAGDVITFNNVNLSGGQNYSIYCRTSNARDRGIDGDPTYPDDSSDGQLSIVSGWANGSATSSFAFSIITVGNINLG